MNRAIMSGLEATLEGGFAALVILAPAAWLFRRLTESLAGAPALRPFVAGCASLGAVAVLGGGWIFATQEPRLVDDAMAGLLIVGGAAAVAVFVVQLLLGLRSG